MKYLFISIVLILFSLTSGTAIADTGDTVCDPGTYYGYSQVAEVPTYDYGPDGLVRFYFKMAARTESYGYSNVTTYNTNCEFVTNRQSPGVNTGYIPLDFEQVLELRAVEDESHPGHYFFDFYDEQGVFKGRNYQVFPSPGPIVQYSFVAFFFGSSHGFSTPAVPVKNTIEQDPVLIIPGTLGTEIYKGTEQLWLDPIRLMLTVDDRFLDSLAFNTDGNPTDDSLTLGRVLKDIYQDHDYSKALLNEFIKQGYKEDENFVYFPYDWRKDISENVNVSLKSFIDRMAPNQGDKLDIIAHSQGGLLIKRLLYEHPEYKSKINKLVFVGTPHLGSPKSHKILLKGDHLEVRLLTLGLEPEEIKRIAKNMPSIYQMLPTKEYFNHYPGYWGEYYSSGLHYGYTGLYNYEQTKERLKDLGYNSQLLDKNDDFHTFGYDQYDFTESGIDTYNIVGCQTPTYAGFVDHSFGRDVVFWAPGDGTVPIASATNVVNVQTSYAKSGEHGAMLTQDGTRQRIVNIITGSKLPTPGITDNITECHFNGTMVSAHSPVDLHIYDEYGNHVGPSEEAMFDANIPNVGYETIGEQKFAFIPKESADKVKLVATDSGEFSFYTTLIREGEIVETKYFDHVPIYGNSIATISIKQEGGEKLFLDDNGDSSIDRIIEPSSVLNAEESKDYTPPVITPSVIGSGGQAGYYRSDVSIDLKSDDVVYQGFEAQTSGVAKIEYRIGTSSPFGLYEGPITVSDEGRHTIQFFSTDRAGNREGVKEVSFVIDKTPPEAVIRFSPEKKDVEIAGTDNISSTVAVDDQGNKVVLADEAGNATILTFAEKDRKHALAASLKSLEYNGVKSDIAKNRFSFTWLFTKAGQLKMLLQQATAKGSYSIHSLYDGKATKLVGLDSSGKINERFNGIQLLQLRTDKGSLDWSY